MGRKMEKEILKTLEGDARLTAKQVAKLTGVPEAKVVKTIKKAEAEGTILKYKTIINWDKFNGDQVWAL
jgi:DNA-binding Lrp family transcriptional regulator